MLDSLTVTVNHAVEAARSSPVALTLVVMFGMFIAAAAIILLGEWWAGRTFMRAYETASVCPDCGLPPSECNFRQARARPAERGGADLPTLLGIFAAANGMLIAFGMWLHP